MRGFKIAGRYAQSLLELAQEKEIVDEVLKDMEQVVNLTNENHDFYVFINSPVIKADKKNDILKKIFVGFQELSISFFALLTKNRREMLISLIAEEFIAQVKKARGIVSIALTSAHKLDEKVKKNILEKMKKGMDGSIELTEKIDESLIGGFVVRMGDTRVDATVVHQLSKMKQRLTR